MAYNIKQKLRANVEAIRIALSFDNTLPLSEPDLKILKSYSGWGGIKCILFSPGTAAEWQTWGATKEDLKHREAVIELHDVLRASLSDSEYKSVVESIKNSVLTSFYTPEVVPRVLFEVIGQLGLGDLKIYEPSAGAGVFIESAFASGLPIHSVVAVEKDLVTGKVLKALMHSAKSPVNVKINGFEETINEEADQSNLIVSNIPFGNFSVFDPDPFFRNPIFGGVIHNYFFAKGISKIANGGILAFLTTDAFMNTPSNREAREYLFKNANYISLVAMPDNLMKDSANTEAPSHLLIVQKNVNKVALSPIEQQLVDTVKLTSEDGKGKYNLNAFLHENRDLFIGDLREGTNQYGKPNLSVWYEGDVSGIYGQLLKNLREDFEQRFDHEFFPSVVQPGQHNEKKAITFLPIPSIPVNKEVAPVQLGLFDSAPALVRSEGLRYISDLDRTVIDASSAMIVGVVKSDERPDHDSIVLLQAKSLEKGVHYFKLYSNIGEVQPGINWFNTALLPREVRNLVAELNEYNYSFAFVGDQYKKLFAFRKVGPEYIEGVNPLLKVDALFVHHDRVGTLKEIDRENNRAVFQSFAQPKDVDFYAAYVSVRDAYLALFNFEHSTKSENAELRAVLNSKYDEFESSYGRLQVPKNLDRLQLADAPFGFSIAHSLEIQRNGEFFKADIFAKSLVLDERVEIVSAIDALPVSLNDRGFVDLKYMSALTGTSESQIIQELEGQIYYNVLLKEWEPVDKFASGNVVEKLKATRLAIESEPTNAYLRSALAAITQAQPKKIPYALLDFNLGERWIPLVYYNQFVSEFFNQPTNVSYSRPLDAFEINYKKQGWNSVVDDEFALTTMSGQKVYGYSLMQYAFENTSPQYTYTVGEGDEKVTMKDSKSTHLAYEKITMMRNRFEQWMRERDEVEQLALETLYNETYNNTVIRKFDGRHLKFSGLDLVGLGIPDLYDSQKNAIWRIIQNRGGLIDHEVGLGKTLTMIVASYEMKRLGIIRKPLIIALKATVKQIVETYKKAYPQGKLLAPKEGDFVPKKRASLFYQIKNNDWDCIVLTHEQFGQIQQSDSIRKEVLNAELEDVEANYIELTKASSESSKALLKGLEVRKTNLKTDLALLQEEIETRKDKTVTFDEMGIDKMFIDESHKFKNLLMNTRHQRVAGLGSSGMVKKTMSMLYAIRELQKRNNADLQVTFLSGTPISNSIKEMYLIFKYLIPNELKRMQIENFDSWIAVFGRKSVDFEFSVTNEIISKERFRYFIKVQELALMYNNITDYRRAAEVNIDRPEIKEVLVNIPPTPAQIEYIAALQMFAKSGDGSVVGYKDGMQVDSRKGGLMLIATNLALKMTADMRLIYPGMEDHPNSKVNQCAKMVAQIWKESSHFKGTQMIFSDIGTPGEGKDFDLYTALKTKLVTDYGIPDDQVSFIHDWTDAKRPILYQKMNDGDIRVLIGSTEKAGTGLNIQNRMVGIHHIDVPWRPSDFEQRNGRGGRKGNWAAKKYCNNEVKAYIYAVEQSLDNYKFNILKNKQTFISQIKSNSLGVRSIDEGAMDEETGMNYSEFLAVLSGDNSLLQKSKIEKKISALESLKQTHFLQISESKSALSVTIRDREKKSSALEKLTVETDNYKSVLKHTKNGSKENPIYLSGINGSKDEETIGNYLIELQKKWAPAEGASEKMEIGSLYNYQLYIYLGELTNLRKEDGMVEWKRPNKYMIKSPRTGLSFTYNSGFVNEGNPKLAARYFLNAIDRVEGIREQHERDLRGLDEKIAYYKSSLDKPFDKEGELQSLKNELSAIEKAMLEKVALSTSPQIKEEEAVIEKAAVVPEPEKEVPRQRHRPKF